MIHLLELLDDYELSQMLVHGHVLPDGLAEYAGLQLRTSQDAMTGATRIEVHEPQGDGTYAVHSTYMSNEMLQDVALSDGTGIVVLSGVLTMTWETGDE